MTQPSEGLAAKPVSLLDARSNWEDILELDSQCTEAERSHRDVARGYAQESLLPRVADAYLEERTYPAIFKEMGALGLLGLTIPKQYGGANASHVGYGLAARELGRVDLGYHTIMTVQSSLIMYPIYAYGDDDQRTRFLPQLAIGEWVGCFGFTEPDAGFDSDRVQAKAKKIAAGYSLSGRKKWISNAPIADLFVVWARSDVHNDSIKAFVVTKDMDGLSTATVGGRLALRTAVIGDVILDEVVVPDENLLRGVSGIKDAFDCINHADSAVAWGVMGAAEDCWHRARRCALDRNLFGRPLAANQLVQKKLADMQTEIALGFQISLRLGRLMDQGRAAAEMISIVKHNNCVKALNIARMAHDICNEAGIDMDNHVMRHMQNLEALNGNEGARDFSALVFGRASTEH